MAITLGTPARNAACNAVVDLLDVGAGANGTLEILDGATILVIVNLSEPAFGNAGAVTPGLATAAGLPLSGLGVAAGEADGFRTKDEDGTQVWTGTASAAGGGGDMILDNVNIAIGQTVNVISWTHTQPA